MSNAETKAHGPFEAEFRRRLDSLLVRAQTAGLSLNQLCLRADVARATPDRWKKKPPLSVVLIDKLESVVAQAEKEAARAQA